MVRATPHIHHPPYRHALPAPVVFSLGRMPPQAVYPLHQHAWGEFVYAFTGVITLEFPGRPGILTTPQHGIWVPPDAPHHGLNRLEAHYTSLYVGRPAASALPAEPCALAVGPLAAAMLQHLRQRPHTLPPSAQDARLLQALVDQLAQAPQAGSYLPQSDDPALGAVLRALQAQPGDERSLADWAASVHSTERTLARRCQRDLGLPFAVWRQRLRVVKALPRLAAGEKVETIALDLGYASASAFIAMFRRTTGRTPDEARGTPTPLG